MSGQITTAFTNQYLPGVRMLAQQKKSRLYQFVDVKPLSSAERASTDYLGKVEMVELSTRHADTPQVDTPHSRRWVIPSPYVISDFLDHQDKIRAVNGELMTSAYQEGHAAAAGRKMDSLIIGAAFATAYTGQTGTGTVSFDTANYQIAAGSAGLTIAKLLQAKEKLDAAENDDPDDPQTIRPIVVSAKQITNLLNTTEVKSADYNTVKALAMGQIDSFCGFKFRRSERLGTDGSGYRRCIAWTKMSMQLGVNENWFSRVSERADKNYLTQIYGRLDMGATRMDETGVVEILCVE